MASTAGSDFTVLYTAGVRCMYDVFFVFSSRFRTFNAFNCVDFRTILIFLTGKHCSYALNSVSARYKVAPLQNVEVVNMATKSGDFRLL